MDKQVHDPSRNVDRAPNQEQREGNRKVDREAKHDREMQKNVDETIEDSFPASDPPSWNSGSSVVQDDERERQASGGERTQDRSAAARVAERNRHRSKSATAHESGQEPSSVRQAMDRHQMGGGVGGHAGGEAGEVRIDDRGMSSQREQPSLADRTPEQRDTNAIGPGPRFEDLDKQVLAEQGKPHLQPDDTDERTDLPGRRAAPQGPHQAFPGETPASKQPRH